MRTSSLLWSLLPLAGLAALGAAPSGKSAGQAQFLNPDGLSKPPGYTHVVVAQPGKLVYISGQVAANAKGEVVGKGDIRAQTTQVMENLKTALAAAGAAPRRRTSSRSTTTW